MAELADAQDLGSCAFGVQVQALLPAPKKREVMPFSLLAFSFALYLVYEIFSRFRKVSAITAARCFRAAVFVIYKPYLSCQNHTF